jgi:periplasmic protein TonB
LQNRLKGYGYAIGCNGRKKPPGLSVTPTCETIDHAMKADQLERLVPPAGQRAREPFAAILVACLIVHALILAVLLFGDFSFSPDPPQAQEISVEVVAQVPPEQKPEPLAKPLPPPPDLVTPPVVKEKPVPEKVQLDDVRAAFDAPAAGNASDTRKGEQNKETQAPRVAPPPKLQAPEHSENKPEQEKAAAPSEEKEAKPPQPSEPQKVADVEPDAEALDKAKPALPAKPKDKPSHKPSKDPAAQGKTTTVAQQLAALSQAPNYSFGAAAKAAPIAGGTEKASYESLLFGLIRRQLHLPPEPRERHLIHVGRIGLFVDELGNLTHQALYLASGDPALDAAWLAAVKRAAPFPPPPRNLPHGFLLQFSNQE